MNAPIKILILLFSWFVIVFICIYNEVNDNYMDKSIKINETISDTFSSVKESSIFSTFTSKEKIEEKIENTKSEINSSSEVLKPILEKDNVITEKIDDNSLLVEKVVEINNEDNKLISENKNIVLEEVIKEEENSIIKEKITQENIIKEKDTVSLEELQNKLNLLVKNNRIVFKRMSTTPSKSSKITISKIALLLDENKNINVEVSGHTDARGKKRFNLNISQKRANSVRKELIKLGIDETRVTAKGYGESQPLVKDNGGYSILNRRVEINIIKE